MSPSRLRLWLQTHSEPVSIREVAFAYQKETGTFAEKRIQRSMKALEAAGLVEFTTGEHNVKMWTLVKPPTEGDAETTEPTAEIAPAP